MEAVGQEIEWSLSNHKVSGLVPHPGGPQLLQMLSAFTVCLYNACMIRCSTHICPL